MNPGLACRSCHLQLAPSKAYFYAGTVYPTLHEKDRCNAPPPAGAKIEILDKNGVVVLTFTPGSSGNFRSTATTTTIQLPYTARVVANGMTRSMTTPQTNGDCNSCHTEQGANGAQGRIVWP